MGVIAGFGGTALGDIALVPAPFLRHPKGIRDVTEWYVSTSSRQDYVHKIFERQTEIAIGNLERIHSAIGDSIQAVFLCGTDFGTQTSSFCSTRTFRSLYLPHYKQMCDWIHAHTSWKVFKHSCGAVSRFIPSFIEAGIDILNPVQCSAAGMEPEQLKAAYGRDIVFWGGGVDTQKVLPFGAPAEVREQVLRRCEVFAPGGGFVFNTIHNIQAQTPVANIVAMLDAVHEFNGGR
jgi:uroporphyrinogen-III decarboxylase